MHLFHDLTRGEVAIMTTQPSRAELATHRTANLTGDAGGTARFRRDHDTLGCPGGIQDGKCLGLIRFRPCRKQLLCAVTGKLFGDHGRLVQSEVF